MPRPPHPTPTDVLLTGDVPGHTLTLAEQQETKDIESDMAFEAARCLGRIEALEFSATVATRAQVEVFIELKKSKAYRAIQYRDSDGNPRRIADLEEFCVRYLGKSARRIQEMAQQYHLLGGDLYEAAERIGFRNQDYRTLKALPADDQEAIRQAMQHEAGRAEIIDLLQEMAARHASEKAALTAEATEAKETAEARDDVIKRKESKISELELRAASAERRQASFTDEEACAYECAPLHDTINETMVALVKMATEVQRLVEEVGGELVTEECFHAVLLPIKRALEIANFNRLHIDLATLFDEQLDASVEALQARAAGLTPGALQ